MKSKSKKKTEHSWLIKAYKNKDFLNSPSARLIRILSEMIEPAARFRKYRVRDTVVFFGSSRIFSRSVTSLKLKMIKKRLKSLFLVHGEKDQQGIFKSVLENHGFSNIKFPKLKEEFAL